MNRHNIIGIVSLAAIAGYFSYTVYSDKVKEPPPPPPQGSLELSIDGQVKVYHFDPAATVHVITNENCELTDIQLIPSNINAPKIIIAHHE